MSTSRNIMNTIAAAAEEMGFDVYTEVAGSGSCYVDVRTFETEKEHGEEIAKVRISNHIHQGGGIGYNGGDVDVEICTNRSIKGVFDGYSATDALKVISRRSGVAMPARFSS